MIRLGNYFWRENSKCLIYEVAYFASARLCTTKFSNFKGMDAFYRQRTFYIMAYYRVRYFKHA